ncbi:ATP-binding protein [Thalassotalea psychrophila]|uniref:histidine kinase n=1 Tax=Thalassotalea psychrophila TaxID=3065647 RepID=A0ABY9TYN6_9GAMM|nr:ATP-binding protein [Colwelliaceae bacterium SQ149]
MGFKKFSLMVALRTVMIMLTLILLTFLITTPGYHAATLLTSLFLIVQCIMVFRFITKTNAELARFLDAARYADFSQRFELKSLGAGFGELGNAFTDILKRFQAVRTSQEEELRHLKAMVEHVPVPLMSVHSDGVLTLWNNSARRLFGSNHVTKVDDLRQFGEDFASHIQSVQPGERRLVTFEVDGMEQQLTILSTQIITAGKQEKLLSMQDIQSELDVVQLQAWQDLVRVLTHEIMNSITPVASLSKTAVDLLDDAKAKIIDRPDLVESLADVSDAIQTVARRSDGLTKFVGSYRRLTRLPPPNKKMVKLSDIFSQVTLLGTQQWLEKDISFSSNIEPAELDINVDKDMIEQLLINLLQNAEQALTKVSNPVVTMNAYLNKRGHAVIDLSDNGAGVADEIAKKVFVPFFTTKKEGSGVGLALTRQVMVAHGGNVKLEQSALGGALFRLTF